MRTDFEVFHSMYRDYEATAERYRREAKAAYARGHTHIGDTRTKIAARWQDAANRLAAMLEACCN